jgi:hypothetical protein
MGYMTGKDRETKKDDLERWKERLGVKKGGSQHPVGNITGEDRETKETI